MTRLAVRRFRADRVAASHPVMIRHRRRATVRGFISNPVVVLAELAFIISASFVLGFWAGGAA